MRRRSLFTSFCLFVVLVSLSLWLSACKRDERRGVRDNEILYLNAGPGVKYMGSKACGSCHPDIYASFQHAEMGRSMSRADAAFRQSIAANGGAVFDSAANLYYSPVNENGRISVREYRLDSGGNLLHDRTVPAEYVMGSGNNLSMLFHVEGGMLYEMPITWYVHKQHWDLSPGYKEFGNLRFARFADERCLSCHNSYLPVNGKADDRYIEPFPLGIGCERCHGPGELHIRQKMGEHFDDGERTAYIVNPAKLSSERQLDVCRQCHLQGKAWSPHDSADWFGFRPGMLLSSNRSVYFPAATQKEVFEVADSPHRLSLSRCFKESAGRLTCITCHDPHHSITTFSITHYNEKCLRCHSPENISRIGPSHLHRPADNCVSCHMKRTGTDNTLHGVSNTDHWIRVGADSTVIDWTTLRTPAERQDVIRLVPDVDADDDGKQVRLGIAYYDYYLQYDRRPAYLDSAFTHLSTGLASKSGNATGYFYLGEAYRGLNRHEDALQAYRRAVSLRPGYVKAVFQAGKMCVELTRPQEAIQSFRNALTLKPEDPAYLAALGMALADDGEYQEAATVLERALAIDKESPAVYSYLGSMYAQSLNRPDKAISAFQHMIELDPDIPDSHLNLANSYALTGNYDEAVEEYRKEISIQPRSSPAYFNLGRTYELKGNIEKARSSYRKALEIDSTLTVAKEYLGKLHK